MTRFQQDDWLRDGFSESLNDHLQYLKKVEVVQREEINAAGRDLNRSPYVPFLKEKQAIQFGNKLKTRYVVIGSIKRNQDRIIIFSRVLDVKSEKIIHRSRYRMDSTRNYRFFDQIQEISEHLSPALKASKKNLKLMKPASKRTQTLKAFEFYILGRLASLEESEARYRVATTWFREAIKADYRYALAYVGLADALTKWGFFQKQTGQSYQENYRKAHENLRKAKKYDPNIPAFHYKRLQSYLTADIDYVVGQTHFNNKNFRKAIAAYRNSIKNYRRDSMTLFRMGEAYLALGENDRARAYYVNALEINPKLTPAIDRLETLIPPKDR